MITLPLRRKRKAAESKREINHALSSARSPGVCSDFHPTVSLQHMFLLSSFSCSTMQHYYFLKIYTHLLFNGTDPAGLQYLFGRHMGGRHPQVPLFSESAFAGDLSETFRKPPCIHFLLQTYLRVFFCCPVKWFVRQKANLTPHPAVPSVSSQSHRMVSIQYGLVPELLIRLDHPAVETGPPETSAGLYVHTKGCEQCHMVPTLSHGVCSHSTTAGGDLGPANVPVSYNEWVFVTYPKHWVGNDCIYHVHTLFFQEGANHCAPC